jgi:hypothetical protein
MFSFALRSLWARRLTYGLVLLEMVVGFICLTLAIAIWGDTLAVAQRARFGGPPEMRITGVFNCPPGRLGTALEQLRGSPAIEKLGVVYSIFATDVGGAMTEFVGLDADSTAVFRPAVAEGRWLAPTDFDITAAQVPVVIGSQVVPELPVGSELKTGSDRYHLLVVGRLKPGEHFWVPTQSPMNSIVTTDRLVIAPPYLAQRGMPWQKSDEPENARLFIYPKGGQGEVVAAAVKGSAISSCLNGDETLTEAVAHYYKSMRPLLMMTGLIAGVILTIGTLGFIGVAMVMVERRMREFAIRLAVGATPRSLGMQALWELVTLSLLAAGIGIPIAWLLAGPMKVSVTLAEMATVAGAGVVVGALAGLGPVFTLLRRPPAQFIRSGQ